VLCYLSEETLSQNTQLLPLESKYLPLTVHILTTTLPFSLGIYQLHFS